MATCERCEKEVDVVVGLNGENLCLECFEKGMKECGQVVKKVVELLDERDKP